MASPPEPAGVAALPHDQRGYPIPVHVGRHPGTPERITEVDPNRVLLLNGSRRCTICAWRIRDDELCWYHTWPPALEQNSESGWRMWDPCIEGGGHKECMVYASIVCPFLATTDYVRKTAQRNSSGTVADKGTPRGDLVLAGVPEMRISFNPDGSCNGITLGGGEPELVYESGDYLKPLLEELLAVQRAPDMDDLDFARLLATDKNEAEIALRQWQVALVHGIRRGLRLPERAWTDPCYCESGATFKACCFDRVQAAQKLPKWGK